MKESQEEKRHEAGAPNPYSSPSQTAVSNNRMRKPMPVLALLSATILVLVVLWLLSPVPPKFQKTGVKLPDAETTETNDSFRRSVKEFGAQRGGAHVLQEDGSVVFTKESSAESSARGPSGLAKQSPHDLWGAIGTRARDRSTSNETLTPSKE